MKVQQSIRQEKRPRGRRRVRLNARRIYSRPRASLIFLLVAGALAASQQFAAAQDGRVGEYELKAAMLYNLSRFVEWPASAYPGPQAPAILCILGHDPFGGALTTLIPKEDANRRPVLIRYLKNEKAMRDCHVLYISSSERKAVAQIFSNLKGSSVLTVGEMAQFAAQGGIIQFTLQDQQVRFEINLTAASEVGLKISSRLLALARIVNSQNHNSDSKADPFRSQSFRIMIFPGPLHAASDHGVGKRMIGTGKSAQAALSDEECD